MKKLRVEEAVKEVHAPEETLPYHLVATSNFSKFKRGHVIRDVNHIKSILGTSFEAMTVKVNTGK